MVSKIKKFEKSYERTKKIKSVEKRKTQLYKLLNSINSSYKYKTKKISNLKRRIKLSIHQLNLKEKNPVLYKKRINSLVRLAVEARKQKIKIKKIFLEESKKLTETDKKLFQIADETGKLKYVLQVIGKQYAKTNIKMKKSEIIKLYNTKLMLIYPESGQWIHFDNLDESARDLITTPAYSVKVESIKITKDKKYLEVKYSYNIFSGLYNVPLKEGFFVLKIDFKKFKRDLKLIKNYYR